MPRTISKPRPGYKFADIPAYTGRGESFEDYQKRYANELAHNEIGFDTQPLDEVEEARMLASQRQGQREPGAQYNLPGEALMSGGAAGLGLLPSAGRGVAPLLARGATAVGAGATALRNFGRGLMSGPRAIPSLQATMPAANLAARGVAAGQATRVALPGVLKRGAQAAGIGALALPFMGGDEDQPAESGGPPVDMTDPNYQSPASERFSGQITPQNGGPVSTGAVDANGLPTSEDQTDAELRSLLAQGQNPNPVEARDTSARKKGFFGRLGDSMVNLQLYGQGISREDMEAGRLKNIAAANDINRGRTGGLDQKSAALAEHLSRQGLAEDSQQHERAIAGQRVAGGLAERALQAPIGRDATQQLLQASGVDAQIPQQDYAELLRFFQSKDPRLMMELLSQMNGAGGQTLNEPAP